MTTIGAQFARNLAELPMRAPRKAKSSRKSAKSEHPQEGESSDLSGRTPLRRTGIRVMGDMPWGSHICIFYETREDLLDTCVTYFEAGLEDNEFCIWAVSDPTTEEDAKASLRGSIADFDRYLAAGQIELVQGREWYLK